MLYSKVHTMPNASVLQRSLIEAYGALGSVIKGGIYLQFIMVFLTDRLVDTDFGARGAAYDQVSHLTISFFHI